MSCFYTFPHFSLGNKHILSSLLFVDIVLLFELNNDFTLVPLEFGWMGSIDQRLEDPWSMLETSVTAFKKDVTLWSLLHYLQNLYDFLVAEYLLNGKF